MIALSLTVLLGPALMDTVNWEQWWLPAVHQSADVDLEETEFLEEMEGDLLSEHVEEEQIDDILSEVSKVRHSDYVPFIVLYITTNLYFEFITGPRYGPRRRVYVDRVLWIRAESRLLDVRRHCV